MLDQALLCLQAFLITSALCIGGAFLLVLAGTDDVPQDVLKRD